MSRRRLLIGAAVVSAAGMVIGPVLLALVAVLFGAAAHATAQPCYTSTGPVVDSGGPVRLPVVGQFVATSEFGMRHNPGPQGSGVYKLHDGIDLAERPEPTHVVAVKDGTVTATPTDDGGGTMIVIGHGAGLETVYMHLASRLVQPGDRVWAGRPIGIEGTTGNSTGQHLHFTVKINGTPTDPRAWFASHGITLPTLGVPGTAPEPVTAPPAALASSPAWVGRTLVPVAPAGNAGTTQPVLAQLPERVGAYTGEQVHNAGSIINAGDAMALPAKAITIGVMTAMGESGLIVLDRGDQAGPDSRGLFQQRDGGAWGSYPDRMNPTISATNFFRALTQVPDYLDLEPTIAAHRTQRNADPYHYARFWAPAVEMVSVLTADPNLLIRLPPSGPIDGCPNPPGPLPAGDGSGAAIVAAATHYLGTPYSWGGGSIDGPSLGIHAAGSLDGSHTVGFDCSGLVLHAVYNATRIRLAHNAETQGHDPHGQPIPRDWSAMQPGDIIAFSPTGTPGTYGHVGIYTGNGTMIHAPRPGEPVQTTQLQGSSYYEPMTWSIRRYAPVGSH